MPQRNPTRFPAGVSNVARKKQYGRIQVFDPARHHVYFNDFDTYATADWTLTETQAGATQGVATGLGGWFVHTNSAASADVSSIQLAAPGFAFTDGKAFYCKTRFKVSDATNCSVAIGAMILDTSPIASAPSEGIYFAKAAAGTSAILKVGKASSYTNSTAFGTFVADTFYTLGYHCEGKQFVSPTTGVASYNFDIFFGTDDNPNLITRVQVPVTNTPVGTLITPTIALQNGNAAANTMTVDYFGLGQSRF
jgi:hypothetical protein